MRSSIEVALPAILLALLVPSVGRTQQPAAVTIQDFEFRPGRLLVMAPSGDSVRREVRWVNNGPSTHTVTADRAGAFNAGQLSPGRTFSFVFTSAGTFEYHCEIHPSMRGQVVVEAQSSGDRDPADYGGGY
ncbi:MAG: cupredoxin domain-containing protein [bacterium]